MNLKRKVLQFSELENESFKNPEPTFYDIYWNDVKFEMCINYKPDDKNAIVFGTGAYGTEYRDKFPLFNRISWMYDFSCTGIWYFDPTMYQHEQLTVGWYYGRNNRWYLEDYKYLIGHILKKLNISPSDTLFFGSSGGGFSSIILATMFHSKASVINPQFSIRAFSQLHVKNLEAATLEDGEELIEERINVADFIAKENYLPKLHILENNLSNNDIFDQLPAFMKGIFDNKFNCMERIRIDFYSNEQGHSGMPDKEYCVQFIKNGLLEDIPFTVSLNSKIENGKILSEVSATPDYDDIEYMFSIYKGATNRLIAKSEYSFEKKYAFNLNESDKYSVNVMARRKNQKTNTYSYAADKTENSYCSPVEIDINTEITGNKFVITANTTPTNKNTLYACYLHSTSQAQTVDRIMYQTSNIFIFTLPKNDTYYSTIFVRSKENENDEYQVTVKKSEQIKFEA